MSRQLILSQITQAYEKLGVEFSRGQASDVEIHAEFVNAGWCTGKMKYRLDAFILADEVSQTVYLWQKTTESGCGLAAGGGFESSFQTGATLFRKIRIVRYGPEGKAVDLTLNLGELTAIVKNAAQQNGWKFKTVLRPEKAKYPTA